tara:strand:- start:4462 stop:4635 length:174 start_codon:yes stop_codon:yes gene_type:complete
LRQSIVKESDKNYFNFLKYFSKPINEVRFLDNLINKFRNALEKQALENHMVVGKINN